MTSQLPGPHARRSFRRCAGACTLALLVLAGCAAGRHPATTLPPADTIFTGGAILTMEDAPARAEALAVRDGEILAVGDRESVEAHRGWRTEMIDLEGGALLPGLIEPHCHPIAGAIARQTVDLSGFTHDSRAEVVAHLRAAVEAAAPGEWVLGFGWDPVMVEDLSEPTLAELDEIAPDRPILVLTQMMHTALINSAGYREIGVDESTPDPEGGRYLRDEQGRLNGVLFEGAIRAALVRFSDPMPGAEAFLIGLEQLEYARAGYTSIGVPGASARSDDSFASLARVSAHPSSPIRTFAYVRADDADLLEQDWKETSHFAVKGIKYWMDGSPYSGGAALREPYRNTEVTRERMGLAPDHVGHPNFTADSFAAAIEPHHRAGHQIAVHVQGEVAIENALDGFAAVLGRHPRDDHRHRLEHNALITQAQLQRAKALGLTPSFFVDHLFYYGDRLPDIVGPERTARWMPTGSAVRAGHRVTIHTDNPATPIGPFRALRTAVTRTTRSGNGPIAADERLSTLEALRGMTIHAAWQLHEDERYGSLRAGKIADLVWLDRNPLDLPSSELDRLRPRGTWLAGERVSTSAWTWRNARLAVRAAWGILTGR